MYLCLSIVANKVVASSTILHHLLKWVIRIIVFDVWQQSQKVCQFGARLDNLA